MKILKKEPLSRHTSFRTGGRARFFVEAESVGELAEAIRQSREDNLPYIILGEGSNVLARDDDFDGYVIRPLVRGIEYRVVGSNPTAEPGTESNAFEVVAGAGENWDGFVADTVSHGLSGIENLSWIPGTVGAAPVQNIGAYGVEVKDVISWVEVFDPENGETKKLSRDDCQFGYRTSIFKKPAGKNLIIVKVAFLLRHGAVPNISYKDVAAYFAEKDKNLSPSIEKVREAVIEIRQKKLPDIASLGTAGSFFKNPIISKDIYENLVKNYPGLPAFEVDEKFVKIPLAWVLDKVCGLNGYREGEVGLFQTQPLAVVNFGKAEAKEIVAFAEKISKIVKDKTNIEIEWEVNLI